MYLKEEDIKSAESFFNLKTKYDIKKIINRFVKGDIHNPERILAKNNLLIHLIETYNLPFKIDVSIRQQCKVCSGRGFDIVPFVTEMTKCVLRVYKDPSGKNIYEGCNGTGFQIDQCSRCEGTGKIGENPCPTCWDKLRKISRGTYLYKKTKNFPGKKCLICQGTGQVKKAVKRKTEISELHICKKCNGSGINDNIGTPLISPEVMIDIQDLVRITNEVFDNK